MIKKVELKKAPDQGAFENAFSKRRESRRLFQDSGRCA